VARLGALMMATFKPGLRRGFKKMIARSKALQVELRKLRPALQSDLREHASSESSPEGSWPRRSSVAEVRASARRAKVVRGRARKAGKRVGARQAVSFRGGSQLLGQLPDTVIVRQKRGSLIARSPVPWSGAHNEGATVGRGSRLPARGFVFISDPFMQFATARLADHVVGGWSQR
jgi:hypothetical protein